MRHRTGTDIMMHVERTHARAHARSCIWRVRWLLFVTSFNTHFYEFHNIIEFAYVPLKETAGICHFEFTAIIQ